MQAYEPDVFCTCGSLKERLHCGRHGEPGTQATLIISVIDDLRLPMVSLQADKTGESDKEHKA